jgi:hypothetical protein
VLVGCGCIPNSQTSYEVLNVETQNPTVPTVVKMFPTNFQTSLNNTADEKNKLADNYESGEKHQQSDKYSD